MRGAPEHSPRAPHIHGQAICTATRLRFDGLRLRRQIGTMSLRGEARLRRPLRHRRGLRPYTEVSPFPTGDLRFTLAQMRAPGHLRPKRLPKKLEFPFTFAISSALCLPSHHCEAGTIARTASMCWPQPAHVVLPHTLHFTGLHMLFSLVSCTLVRRCSILSNPSPDSARLLRSSASPSRASD